MRSVVIAPLLALSLPVAARVAQAQDVEAQARASGRRLPAAYYEQVRRQPDLFRPRAEWVTRLPGSPRASQFLNGHLHVIAVAALFADSPDPPVSQAQLQQALFGTTPGSESLHDFYDQLSAGRLSVVGQVTPWVRTSLTAAEVGGSANGLGADARVAEFIEQALALADPLVDFGAFDSNGPDDVPNSSDDNGIVDIPVFYFPTPEGPCGGDGLWPGFSALTPRVGAPYQTDDLRPNGAHVLVDQYVLVGAVGCSGSGVQTISALAHELGHVLGLPDLYDDAGGLLPSERRWVIGCWSLMAAGGWGCGTPHYATWPRPTFLDAWSRRRLGWLDDVQVLSQTGPQEIDLQPVQTSRQILAVPLSAADTLLLEYRTRESFDRDLPAAGVLVYRVNDTLPFRPCPDCAPLYQVQLLEADGNGGLVKSPDQGGNSGEAGDAYGAAGPGRLTNLTSPSTRVNAGTGAESDVDIYRITLEDGVAKIFLTNGIPESDLLAPFYVDPAAHPDSLVLAFLDQRNNANGHYDVGDLRSYLQRKYSQAVSGGAPTAPR